MNVIRANVDDLVTDPANVRTHDERNLQAIRSSLHRFGQQKPIVIDARGVVRAGNGTLEAARQLGWDTIAVVRSDLEGSEATAYAIADNRSAELATWDDEALSAILQSLDAEGFDLGEIGFVEAEIDRLVGEVVADPASEWQGMPACENGDETAYRSLHVHFATPEAVADFMVVTDQQFTPAAKYIWHPAMKMERPSATPYVARNEP